MSWPSYSTRRPPKVRKWAMCAAAAAARRLPPALACRFVLPRHLHAAPLGPCRTPFAEFDPEADVFGAGPALEESDEELAAQPSARRCARCCRRRLWLTNVRRACSPCQDCPCCSGKAVLSPLSHPPPCVPVSVLPCALRRKGKEAGRLRGDIVMEGRDYSGRSSSRAAVFGAGEEEEAEEAAAQEGGSEEEAGAEGSEEGSDEEEGGSSGSEDGEEGGWLIGNAAGGSGGSSGDEEDDEEPEEAVAGTGGIARRRAAKAGAAPAGGGDNLDQDGAGGSSSDEEGQERSCAVAAAAAAAGDEMAALQREYEQMQQVCASSCLPSWLCMLDSAPGDAAGWQHCASAAAPSRLSYSLP
jgi:hypothetical protein